MAGSITIDNAFATQSGNVPASELDTNFSQLAGSLNALASFANYYVDSGVANAISVTVPSPQVVAYAAGLLLVVKIAATNTGASTINVNGLGNVSVVYPGGGTLLAGQLVGGSLALLAYDGTNFEYLGSAAGGYKLFKSATTTRASSTSLTIDPDLQVALLAGSYTVDMLLNFSSTSATNGGIQLEFELGGAAVTPPFANYYNVNGVSGIPSISYATGAYFSFATLSHSFSPAFQTDFLFLTAGLTLATAATLALYWAQESSSAGNAQLLAGSYLRVLSASAV